MGTAIGQLISLTGWSEKACRILVTLGLVVALCGALAGAIALYDKGVINRYQQKQETRARPATERASEERVRDALNNARQEQEMKNVIVAAPDQPIAPSSLALGCERLRRVGKHPPECGGSTGGH